MTCLSQRGRKTKFLLLEVILSRTPLISQGVVEEEAAGEAVKIVVVVVVLLALQIRVATGLARLLGATT